MFLFYAKERAPNQEGAVAGAEENSPVGCFLTDVGNEQATIGTAAPEKSLFRSQDIYAALFCCIFHFPGMALLYLAGVVPVSFLKTL